MRAMQVRMTNEEYAQAKERAREVGLSMSEWVRRKLFEPPEAVPRVGKVKRVRRRRVKAPPAPPVPEIPAFEEFDIQRLLEKSMRSFGIRPTCEFCGRALADCGCVRNPEFMGVGVHDVR